MGLVARHGPALARPHDVGAAGDVIDPDERAGCVRSFDRVGDVDVCGNVDRVDALLVELARLLLMLVVLHAVHEPGDLVIVDTVLLLVRHHDLVVLDAFREFEIVEPLARGLAPGALGEYWWRCLLLDAGGLSPLLGLVLLPDSDLVHGDDRNSRLEVHLRRLGDSALLLHLVLEQIQRQLVWVGEESGARLLGAGRPHQLVRALRRD